MKPCWAQNQSHKGRSWSFAALLILSFNPLKSLISTWLRELNSLIPASVWRWVLVYVTSQVMQAECVRVQQWVGVPEDLAEAEAVFALCAAGGIRCRRRYICSLLVGLQRVPPVALLWCHRYCTHQHRPCCHADSQHCHMHTTRLTEQVPPEHLYIYDI